MANRISVILDVATDKATGALKGFKQSVADADGAFGKLKAGGKSAFDSLKANSGAAALAVGGALVGMGAKAVGAASDLAESVNAVEVTFGPVAEGIKKLGTEAAESVGLSNSEFNGLAVQFSSFATTVAGEKGNIVGTIDEMTTRVADFASVMNLDVPEAARIFQSALAGETEPIKKFGIDLSAASVAAFAVEDGIVAAGQAMTESDKTVARYRLLMQETEQTAGDFKNTSDGLANQQRILKARVEDAAAAMGELLVPVMADVVGGLSAIVEVAEPVAGVFDGIIGKTKGAAYEIGSFFGKLAAPLTGGGFAEQTLTDLENIEGNIGKVFETVSAGAGTMEEFVANLDRAGITGYERSLLILEFAKSVDVADEATIRNTGSLIDMTEKAVIAGKAAEGLKAAIDKKKKADEEAEGAAKEHTAALEAQRQKTDELHEAHAGLVGSDIAVRDAQRQAGDAVAALNLLMEEGKGDSEEYRVAQDDAATAVLGAATAAAELKVKQAEANGETVTAATKNELFKAELEKVASTLAPGSPLRAQIDGYIADLEAIPAEVRTNLRVTGAVTTRDGDLIGVRPIDTGIGMYATGGMVPGPVGKPQLAIVHGGEEVLTPAQQRMDGNGHVAPGYALITGTGATPAFNITVNAGMGANGKEIGDVIVAELKKYTRRNGPGWMG